MQYGYIKEWRFTGEDGVNYLLIFTIAISENANDFENITVNHCTAYHNKDGAVQLEIGWQMGGEPT